MAWKLVFDSMDNGMYVWWHYWCEDSYIFML